MRFTVSLLGIALFCASVSFAQNSFEKKEFVTVNGKKHTVVKKVETKTKPKLMSQAPVKVELKKSKAIRKENSEEIKK